MVGGDHLRRLPDGQVGIGEIFLTVEEGLKIDGMSAHISLRTILDTIREMPRYWRTLLRGAVIGCWMGIKPGGPRRPHS